MRHLLLKARPHERRVLRSNPFTLLDTFEHELSQAFRRDESRFNFVEKDKHYLLSLDLPGVTKDDIEVHVAEGYLTVQGKRKDHVFEDYDEHYQSFSHSVRLPKDIDDNEVKAHFENGVLMLAVAKKAKDPKRTIEVVDGARTGFWNKLLTSEENSEADAS